MIDDRSPLVHAPGPSKVSNNFTFLHVLFASLVIFTHTFQLLDGTSNREPLILLGMPWTLGHLAVDGIFLFSGYLVTQSWLRDPHLFRFLRKRTLRIYPGFLAAVLFSALLIGPLGGNPSYWRDFDVPDFLINMAWLRVVVPPTFEGEHHPHVNGSLWTIPYTFVCYLVLAFLGCLKALRSRTTVFALWVASMALYAWQFKTGRFYLPGLGYAANMLFSSTRYVTCFLAGSCFFLYRDRIRYTKSGVALAASLLFLSTFRKTPAEVFLPVLFGYLAFACAFARPAWARKSGRVADISYGTYLYGWPIQMTIIHQDWGLDPYLISGISLPLSYGAAFLSWHAVERPCLRLKLGPLLERISKVGGAKRSPGITGQPLEGPA